MGTAPFAVPSLEALHKTKHEIVAVISQPDKPAGRGRLVASPPVVECAKRLGLQVYQPRSLKNAKVLDNIRAYEPDLIIVVAYGKILPAEILALPKNGCINVHSSLLPKYRGAAPINWAIVNGEKESGVTTMFINEELDAGDILQTRSILIDDGDTAITLHNKLAPIGADLLLGTLDGVANGTIKPTPQNRSKATYAPIIKKEDGHIDWRKDAKTIRNLIRGMQPWPTAYSYMDKKFLRIFSATLLDSPTTDAPGTVHTADGCLIVATGNGKLCINELQLEGKKRMMAHDFLNGHKIKDGTILE